MNTNDISYYKNYPERFEQELRRNLFWNVGCLMLFLLLAFSAAVLCVLVLVREWNLASALGLIISAGFLVFFSKAIIGTPLRFSRPGGRESNIKYSECCGSGRLTPGTFGVRTGIEQ